MLVQAASNRNTIVIDTGLSINQAENLLSAAESHVDFIKFGFGTAFFTGGFERKLALYRASGIRNRIAGLWNGVETITTGIQNQYVRLHRKKYTRRRR